MEERQRLYIWPLYQGLRWCRHLIIEPLTSSVNPENLNHRPYLEKH